MAQDVQQPHSSPLTAGEKTYYRASLGLKGDVAPQIAAEYHSAVIDGLRSNGTLRLHNAARGTVTLHLAREFGFCYGVDKAVDMAYEARQKFPDRRIFLLTEIIHNPRVNRRMSEMGIRFLSGALAKGDKIEDIRAGDVVLIPAFGTSHSMLERVKAVGAIIVDTTCGSVVHVWKRVERYAREGFTSLVHGKYAHEETIATVSQAAALGGHYLVVRNKTQAQRVCDFIEGRLSGEELMGDFAPEAYSAGFDPALHLRRVGVANQTTMLATESLEIARMAGEAITRRDGEEQGKDNFRSFDTICSATQDRQDAMQRLMADNDLDLCLVIGGYNSSNTRHLLEVAMSRCPASYHIADSSEIQSAEELWHQPLNASQRTIAYNWLPLQGNVTIGLTAGASTPNRAIGDAVARLLALRGFTLEEALAALEGKTS